MEGPPGCLGGLSAPLRPAFYRFSETLFPARAEITQSPNGKQMKMVQEYICHCYTLSSEDNFKPHRTCLCFRCACHARKLRVELEERLVCDLRDCHGVGLHIQRRHTYSSFKGSKGCSNFQTTKLRNRIEFSKSIRV